MDRDGAGNRARDVSAYGAVKGFFLLALLVVLIMASSRTVAAQVVRLGDNVRANSFVEERQCNPRVSALVDGAFVIVWDGPQDANLGRRGIISRRFAASGEPVGSETLVNATSESDEYNEAIPVVAGLNAGGFVVAWEGPYGQDGDFEGVFGQILDSGDNKIGSEFRVNTKTTYSQQQPDVTSLPNGGFVVAWLDAGLLGANRQGPTAKVYDSEGGVVSQDFALTTFTTGIPNAPQIASTADGNFVAVWASLAKDGDADAVVVARFTSEGNPLTSEAVVNVYTTGTQSPADVARLTDGRFVVVWNSVGQDGDGVGAVARLLTATGIPTGNEIAINPDTSGDQLARSVAASPFGGFVATWRTFTDEAAGYDVRGRYFTSQGLGSAPFPVASDESGNQVRPGITSLPNGQFVVVWESQTETVTDIFFQRYCLQWIDEPTCGKAACVEPGGDDSDPLTASDAFAILEGGIALRDCVTCVCDTNSSGNVTATDALLVLQRAVNQAVPLVCPACSEG